MKKIISALFISSLLLTACGVTSTPSVEESATAESTRTARPQPTSEAQSSRLGVNAEALDGLEITVWYPWYEVEASLFETLVKEFNQKNEWGIQVSAQGQVNFNNLYEAVNAALPT